MANAIDEVNELRNETESGEVKRLSSIAILERLSSNYLNFKP